jgi:hypothetical protein
MKRLVEIEDLSCEYVKKLLEELEDYKNLEKYLKKVQEDLQESSETVEKLNRENKELKEKNFSNKRFSEKPANQEKKEKKLILEIVKLENEVQTLRNELSNKITYDKVQNEPKKETKIQELEEQVKIYKRKSEKIEYSLLKLQLELGDIKNKEKLAREIADSHETVRQAQLSQITSLKESNKSLCETNSLYEERIQMTFEELYSFNQFKSEYYKLRNEKTLIHRKMRQLEAGVITSDIKAEITEEFISSTDPIFKLIQNPEKFKSRSMSNTKKMDLLDISKINLSQIKPCRPTFASLIRIPVGHVQFSPTYRDWLFVTIRAIFDSKQNEHLLRLQSNSTPLTFPEFVYDWLGQFTVDNGTRVVKQLEWWTKNNADTARLQLLAGLALPRSKRVWELNTFREFLLEEIDLDELAFYLHCRFLLFQGPQLATPAGRFAATHYVSVAEAKQLVLTVMEGLHNESVSHLLGLIEEKAKKKPGNVESSFILRVLLEYYHREKKLKYVAIQELFYRCSKSEFNFESFKDVCLSLDSKLPPHLIAKAYREAYTDGNGFISADGFYVVANNLLFFHMLKLKNPWKIPKLNEFGEIDPNFNEYSEYMAKADQLFKEKKRDVEIIGKFVENLGVPDFHRCFANLELILNRKYQFLDEFKTWNLADAFKQFWVLVIRAKLVFYEHNALSPLGIRNNSIENKECDLRELMESNKHFIEDIADYQWRVVKLKILVRRLQRRAKAKPRVVTLIQNIVRSLGSMKKAAVHK